MNETCDSEGCLTDRVARGLCMKHYKAASRAGTLPPKVGRTNAQKIETILTKVEVNADTGCWEYQGKLRDGYGPHRKLYELIVGPIPATKPRTVLDHTCRVKHCVNPDHLDPVTDKVNILRGDSPMAVMLRTGKCAREHAFEGDNIIIRKTGQRACRECENLKSKRYRQNKKSGRT